MLYPFSHHYGQTSTRGKRLGKRQDTPPATGLVVLQASCKEQNPQLTSVASGLLPAHSHGHGAPPWTMKTPLVRVSLLMVSHRLKVPLCPGYPDWGRSVPVSDLNSLKQQDCCGREFRENGATMADVSAPPPGATCPQGMLARGDTTTPRGHTHFSG